MSLFLGLMSGTSLDGIDGVVASWPDDDAPTLQVLAHVHQPFEATLRDELMALNQPGADELERSARAANAGSVSATPDPNAAIALAWQHITTSTSLC